MGSFDIAKKWFLCCFRFPGLRMQPPLNAEDCLIFIENSKKTLKRVCQTPELTGDKLFSKMKIYPSVNEGLNAFNKKIRHYLIFGPIRNKINEFYFNKNTEKKSKTAQFKSDQKAGIPIGNP